MKGAGRPGQSRGEQAPLPLTGEGTAGAALETIMRQARNGGELGRWFESITLKLLAVEPDLAVAQAWPWATWPDKPSGRDGRDLGVDIVAKASDGRLIAIQCKCRSRDGDTLSKGSINSFIAEAGARLSLYDELWVVSNVALSRNAVTALDRLAMPCKHILFQRYSDTLLDAGESPDRREPNSPQQKAIAAVLDGFSEHDRGKLIMACGSGKTFTALRITEALLRNNKHPTVLFAAPSIALVGQARREWLTHCVKPLSTIVVCSSKAEGRPVSPDEAADISAHELSCTVTTGPDEIARFMQDRTRGSAVFCTYQSLARITEAQRDFQAPEFDLAIADEAHRTTGEFDKSAKGRETDWRLFLDSDRLGAKKRLYMTATPRIYTARSKKQAAAHGVNVVDMNSPEYGPTFHELSFRDAVNHGLLCDYRVIVLAINNRTPLTTAVRRAFEQAVDESGLSSSRTKRREVTRSEQIRLLGTSLAVNGAIEGDEIEVPECLPRTLTFANTCKMSDWIARAIKDGRTQRLTSFRLPEGRRARKVEAVHMDASSPANTRLIELDKLRNATDTDCRMISNVRLFSEGIDIPALDGIVFFEARRAQIDIVQAVGRVMRKAEGKKLGYVVVPVVVPHGANVIDALKSSDEGFDRIGAVLCALQSHDPSLADQMSEYVHIAQPARPKEAADGGLGGSRWEDNEQTELPFDLSEAKEAIYAYIGSAAGFHNRKDLVESHIRVVVESAASMIVDAELSLAMGEVLGLSIDTKEERRNAATLAALLIVNGMILSHRLAPRIEQLRDDAIQRLRFAPKPYAACRQAWHTILRKDYAPIFVPALAVLEQLKDKAHAPIISYLASSSLEVAATISDFSYDHSGPLFHRILGKRGEADGAFYTNNLAALLLAGLAIPKTPGHSFRLIDPACGTGTLLLAALDTIKRHVMVESSRTDESKLHKRLVEKTIHGLDINHHATQLAAANLTLGAATVNFDRMNIATVREGVGDGTPYAGSLELLPTDVQQTLPEMRTPLPELHDLPGANASGQFDPKNMDLVISNPPYTEINKWLAKLPKEDDKILMRRHFQDLRESLATQDALTADVLRGTRAVGPYFIPLASHLVKPAAGTLALVRPTSALTSPSGNAERRYLAQHFHLETTVTSHANRNAHGMGINFSENTDINETLLVLRRSPENKRNPTKVVALHRQPESRAEVLELLEAISTGDDVGKFGRMGAWPAERVAAGDWSFANWYDETLAEVAIKVSESAELQCLNRHATLIASNPNFTKVYKDADEDAEQHIFASISADLEKTMRSTPTHGIRTATNADEKLRRGIDRPARFFLAFRARPSTTRILAMRSTRPCLSKAYHGLQFRSTGNEYPNAIIAFLNSTLGWLQVLNQRAFTLTYTRIKPVSAKLLRIPHPDSRHVRALAIAYKDLARSELSSLREANCPVRKELDRVAAKVVGMPVRKLHDIRRRIAAEPSVSGGWTESED